MPTRPKSSRAAWKMQSIRLLATDNNAMKKIAKREGLTFNHWAVKVLLREVKKQERKSAEV